MAQIDLNDILTAHRYRHYTLSAPCLHSSALFIKSCHPPIGVCFFPLLQFYVFTYILSSFSLNSKLPWAFAPT